MLTDLRLTARAGELTVLLGPNGAGKSTLLRTLCGLLPPLAGAVRVAGRDVSHDSALARARRLAVVLTDRVDPGLLSARELVSLGRHPHTGFTGRLTPTDHGIVRWALDAVDAAHLADRPAAELSDGERQRVLTARALAQEPEVILLDEPTAFLDVPSRVALTVLLRDLARDRGPTVVVSTHDLELALRVADAVWLVDRTGLVHSGAPEDLIRSGAVADTFDADHLAFDAHTGTFGLRRPVREEVPATAPPALLPLLERALAREGLAVRAPRTDERPRIQCEASGRFTLRTADGARHPAGFHELAREVRAW
ncbi:ABC transporter ATP-binding protein [Streptomyces sp. OF3]|uniref:ABC transporter ATP-binding protein n=1 Tax=Streptomyces alkaliterrae TaxID=2213162 RepID=A0A5P0YSP1_9ACTN|nr:ABC transporter ATP-binding protein [Streptomyces alkaliterrae]MBB1258056.1 ABC transporter ATP-binding protein [Streptomyces alkaliterrae]MQS02617.1 ATP-binding cassette domain-containing protein [Streptomyces alkaliterrae]